MKELMTKKDSELQNTLKTKREELRVFRFASSGSKVKNIKEGKNIRREIARILTVLNAKKIITE